MSSTETGAAVEGPPPVGAPLAAKQEYAAAMIKEEQEDMDRHGWDVDMDESDFGDLPRTKDTRHVCAGEILAGMVIRGRLQAAVFDTFMELCLHGVCSLSALERPVSSNNRSAGDNPRGWIARMLGVFNCRTDLYWVQRDWGIRHDNTWFDYDAPYLWFETVVARSFTSLDAVFNITRRKGLLGTVNVEKLKRLYASCESRNALRRVLRY